MRLVPSPVPAYHPAVPIYEYLCEGCGRISEVIQKATDAAPPACPECGSRKIARLVSRSAFQLKGGGWYADLYGSSTKDAKGGSGAAGGVAKKGEAKGEAKEAKTTADAAKPSPASEGKPAAPVKKGGD